MNKILSSVRKIIANLSNRKNILIILFLIMILSRVPGIMLLETENEPGGDGAYYYDIASNIGQGNGLVTSSKEVWYDDWETRKGETETPAFVPPVFPFLLSILFKIDNSLLSIRILNVLVSSFSICLYYVLMEKLFDKEIAFLSSLILITNPIFYYLSVSLLTEMLFIFFSLIVLNLIFSNNFSESKYTIILAGLISGIIVLTRFVGLLLVISIGVWILTSKKSKSGFVYYLTSVAMVMLPWLLISKASVGMYIPYLSIFSFAPDHYPPIANPSGSGGGSTIQTLILQLIYISRFSNEISTLSGFYILLPFIFYGIIINFRRSYYNLSTIYFMVCVSFHLLYAGGLNSEMRYFILSIILLVPVGVNQLKKYILSIESFGNNRKLDPVKNLWLSIMVILVLGILASPFYILSHHVGPFYDDNESKYEWFNENSEPDDVLGCTENRHAGYFTKNPTLRLPHQADETELINLINDYNISYIVLEEINEGSYTSPLYNNLFTQNTIGEIIELESLRLILVHISFGEKYDIRFYQIEH